MTDQPEDQTYGQPNIYDGRTPIQLEQQTEGALIYQLDATTIIESIERNLKGQVWDEDKKVWEERMGMRVMSDIGVARISAELQARLSKNTFLSNLPEEVIVRICIRLHMNLTKMLCLEWRKWEMGKSDISSTLYKIMDIVETALYRGKNKTTLNYLRPQISIGEQGRFDLAPKKKKLFGVF